jgi:hypothetical protein
MISRVQKDLTCWWSTFSVITIVICYISYVKSKLKLIFALSAQTVSYSKSIRDTTCNCSVMSSCFASALTSIQISWSPSRTINWLRSWSRNPSQLWSNLSNLLPFVHTIIPLKLALQIDLSSHNSTLGTWSLYPHFKNPLIYHWLRERNCFVDDFVRRRYSHQPFVEFNWSTKSGLKISSEAREKSTSLNRIIALFSIEWN